MNGSNISSIGYIEIMTSALQKTTHEEVSQRA